MAINNDQGLSDQPFSSARVHENECGKDQPWASVLRKMSPTGRVGLQAEPGTSTSGAALPQTTWKVANAKERWTIKVPGQEISRTKTCSNASSPAQRLVAEAAGVA